MRLKCLTSLLALSALPLALGAGQTGKIPEAVPADAAATSASGPGKGTAAGDTPGTAGPSEGSALVEKILKDKEDLIMGKRFIYDPAGRRDPFRSLLEQVARFKGPRPKGIRGMLIGEANLVGTVRDPRGNIAFFKGSDNKGYFLHVGDEMYDGRIIGIDADSGTVTFRQQVDDPRQIKPYRDITKRVSPLVEEEAQ